MAKTSFFEEGVRAGGSDGMRKGRKDERVGRRKGENEKPVETWGWSGALPTRARKREGTRIGSFLYKRSSVITSRRSPSDFVPRNIQLYNNLKAKAGPPTVFHSYLSSYRPPPAISFARSFISFLECRASSTEITDRRLPLLELYGAEY